MKAEIHQTLLSENQREALKNCLVQICKIQQELAGGTSRRLPCGKMFSANTTSKNELSE